MAGISQNIPHYFGGISQQPDQLKNSGQVNDIVNAIPDITYGLYKRPGSKRVGELANVQANSSWFHYYRDETEGSYIGQIDEDGVTRIWKASGNNAGAAQTIAYGSTDGATEANLKAYLNRPNNSTDTEQLQIKTINDTTFVNNKTVPVVMANSNTAGRNNNETYAAYVELLRTENGRQYGMNIFTSDTETTLNRATRIKIDSDTLNMDWGTGHCPGIGTQVFSVDDGSKKNLTFRISILGQTGESNQDDKYTDAGGFRASYNRRLDLLHGGEGWATNDVAPAVTLDEATSNYTYTIKVVDSEQTSVKATINGGVNGLIRPAPTPFDADTAVTADTILGGIVGEMGSTGLTTKVIGNGLYIYSTANFSIEIQNPDLMRVMQHEINDVTKLPSQCRHGYIIKVSNSQMSDEDDYYLKFVGQNNKDGPGSWVECAAPGVRNKFDNSTMPVVIKRTAIANQGTNSEVSTFTVDRYDWTERDVGDDTTNPIPSFVSITSLHPDHSGTDDLRYINKVLFFRNRLAFLSGSNIITSQPGGFNKFWTDTALTVSAIDPIDISVSSVLPSALHDGVDTNVGLLAFTSSSQYLLSSDDAILNPDTAKLREVSNYNYNKTIPPVKLGTTIGFVDNSNKWSRFMELGNVVREGEPIIVEQSKVVPTLLDKNIDLITNSTENNLVLFGKTGSDTVIGYKYLTMGDQRIQSAWFKWKFNKTLKYQFIVDDQYFFVDNDDYLQSLNFIQSDSDLSITNTDLVNYLIHLDNWTTISGGSYDAGTNVTTFSNVSWLSTIANAGTNLIIIDIDTAADRKGSYTECTVAGTTITVPGNWSSSTLNIGYLYDYEVDFPRLYPTKTVGKNTIADISSSLILHRLNFSFGKVGLYKTTLTRKGKDTYNDLHESPISNDYAPTDAPYLESIIKTIPVYDKNSNVDIKLTSSHPSPCTLRSLSWEGDYSPMFYKRV